MRTSALVWLSAAALAVGPTALPAFAQATAAQARPPWHVTLKPGAQSVVLGKRVRFTGHVRGDAAGKHVKLQEKFGPGKPWRLQRYAKVAADGTFKTFDIPTNNHPRTYRVVMPTTTRHAYGVSPVVAVTVFRWKSLTSFVPVNPTGIRAVSAVNMNAVSYPTSLSSSPFYDAPVPFTESVEYNLDHKCTSLRTTYGMSDASAATSQVQLVVTADGGQIYDHTFGVGQTDSQTTVLATPLKLHIDATSLVPGAHGYGVLGTPQVLCTR
jgi:hypothetical protein